MNVYEDLVQIVGEENIKREEPLSEHTTFRIGGAAKLFVTPGDVFELQKVIDCVKEKKERFYIIGNGSNLLVPDAGFDGVIISTHRKENGKSSRESFGLRDYREVSAEDGAAVFENLCSEDELSALTGETLSASLKSEAEQGKRFMAAGGGVMLSTFANGIAESGLTGFEFASGIPGTLGGAVIMNAGAYGGEIADCILGALVLTEQGKRIFLTKDELGLRYRTSRVQTEKMIVLLALFGFLEGKKEEIRQRMRELNEKRREKQPLNFGSAGSTFKRPEGMFAGKLIEDAGLKGYRVGDVMVSEKHAGFVVNVGNGTYEQAMTVIRHVQEAVKEKFDVALETEVKILE